MQDNGVEISSCVSAQHQKHGRRPRPLAAV